MKYIKEYKQYLNESNDSEFGFSILGIFKPFARLISNLNTGSKLISLIKEYDEYLYNVYIEYLERKKHMPKEELENSEISVIGQDNKIPLSVDDNKLDLEDDKKSDSTDSSNKSDSEDDKKSDSTDSNNKFDSEDDKKSDSSNKAENKTPDVYSSKKNMMSSPFFEKDDSEEFAGMIDDMVKEKDIQSLNNLKQEYIEVLKNNNVKHDIKKKDYNNYFSKRRKLLEEILTYEKGSPEYKKIDKKLNVYNQEVSKLNIELKNLAHLIGQDKLYLEEIKRAITYLQNQNISTESEHVTESNDWRGGGVHDLTWTDVDVNKITALVNPFQVEEYHLKADTIITNSKNLEKFKSKWNLYLNSVYKKWYYTFDVRNLRNLSPTITHKIDKKGEEVKKDLAYSSLILEELFPNIKTYSYRFRLLGEDKNKYFILLSKNNMMLLKKVLFKDNIYTFQFLSVLRPNTDNTNFIAPTMLNTTDEKMKILVNDKELSLFKERKDYPIFFIYEGNMYTSTDFEEFNSISLKNCNIYSLKDESFKKLIKNSNIHYEDKLPSESTFEKIKNITLK